ncbi:MAG: ABC transporter permease [Bacillota bacterium]|nr:ABC transporter permease [Bacillota bacterium]
MKKTIGWVLIILVWQACAALVNKSVFPAPTSVFMALFNGSNFLFEHCAFSILRIFTGVAISLLIGVPTGILMGYFNKVDKALSPIAYFVSPIPKIALLPLIMLIFGIGEFSKIFIIVIIMIFQVIVTVRDSVKTIPEEYFIPFFTVRAPKRRIISDIILPASLPEIFTSIRIGLATAISVLFFTETFGTRYGMGFFIMDMWMRLDYPHMYLGIILLAFIGFVLTALLDYMEKLLCPWKKTK